MTTVRGHQSDDPCLQHFHSFHFLGSLASFCTKWEVLWVFLFRLATEGEEEEEEDDNMSMTTVRGSKIPWKVIPPESCLWTVDAEQKHTFTVVSRPL